MISRPQRLLGEALDFSARNHPDKIAAIFNGNEYTYKYFKDCAENLANHLVKDGIKKGDRIAIYLNNSWQSIVSVYGITIAGGVFLVINPQTKANKLNYILKDSGARIVITEALLISELSEAIEDLPELIQVLISGEYKSELTVPQLNNFDEVILKKTSGTELPLIIPNDLAALIYTSGSTGFPKGVMTTHQSMVFTSWSLIEYLRLNREERIMLVLPLAFDYGLYQLIMSVTIGGSLIIEHSFNFPPTIFRQIEQLKPTIFPGLPCIYAMMLSTHKKTV